MTGGILDTEELAALREVLGDTLGTPPTVGTATASGEAHPVALIADDRMVRSAQSEALNRANRWCIAIRPRLLRGVRLKVQVHVDTAETQSGALLRDNTEGCWTRVLEAKGRPGAMLMAVSGPIVEVVAAILLGADPSEEPMARDRAPSETARGVFNTVGDSIVAALAEAWRDERQLVVRAVDNARTAEAYRVSLGATEALVVVTVNVSGATSGQIRLFSTPEVYSTDINLGAPRRAPASVFGDVLAQVPVEVCVELGTAPSSMAALANLVVGQVITLDRAIDEPLPLTVAGTLKAVGTPVITRGVLGVEIVRRASEKEPE